MKEIKRTLLRFAVVFVVLQFSCSDSGGGSEEPPEDQITPPAKAVGILPVNGEPCSDYQEIVDDNTKVLVAFGWNTAELAQSYILVISEGSTELFRNSFSTLKAEAQLDRGKTYTWQVISVNEDGQTNGDTFSFTTPGTPVGNFAPYAAGITIQFNIESLEMTVSWIGSDEDGDQLTYDVTVWENESILIEEIDYTLNSIDSTVFKSGANYSVEVVSKDSFGNFSISEASGEAPE